MFSEVSGERFVCRTRAGPLCPSVWSKIHLCGHHEKRRNNDFDGVCSCLWCVVKEDHMSLLPWMWSHRSWMTTKSQNLNISVFRHPSPWDLETPGQTRLHCVLVVLCLSVHTLTCIFTFTCTLVVGCQTYGDCPLVLHDCESICESMTKDIQKICRHVLIYKIHGPVFTTRLIVVVFQCCKSRREYFVDLDGINRWDHKILNVYYEQQIKREVQKIHISGCQYNERLKSKTDGSNRHGYTGFRGDHQRWRRG